MKLKYVVRDWMIRELERRGFSVTRRARYASETSRHRHLLAPFCTGYGCDVGFGGDPIRDSSIAVDLPEPYAHTGGRAVQLGGDCANLQWFRDGSLDYIYSSHLLEDFDERTLLAILEEWKRVLKPGGLIVLLLPDQQRYLAHCKASGEQPNSHHELEQFSLTFMRGIFKGLTGFREKAAFESLGDYSFAIVFEKRPS